MDPDQAIRKFDKLETKSPVWWVIVLAFAVVALLGYDTWVHRKKCEALEAEQIQFLKITITQVNNSLDRAADALERLSRKDN